MRLSFVLHLSLRTLNVIGCAPQDDLIDKIKVVAPNSYVHAGVSAFVRCERIQVSRKQVLADVDITLEGTEVEQS